VVSFLCLPSLLAQSASGYLTAGEPSKVAGKRSDAVQVKIPLSVQAGYHVNSNTPSDTYLIPLKLTWTSTGALEGGTVTYPKPSMEKYEFSPEISANATAGPGIAAGKLQYQACSSKACFPPKKIDITVPYQVQ
jgi:hypothetical protein